MQVLSKLFAAACIGALATAAHATQTWNFDAILTESAGTVTWTSDTMVPTSAAEYEWSYTITKADVDFVGVQDPVSVLPDIVSGRL